MEGNRLYYPAWHQLKTNPTEPLKIAAPKRSHARIIKAITKEKWLDVTYKLQLSQEGKYAILRSKCDHNMITFTLRISVGLDDLGFKTNV